MRSSLMRKFVHLLWVTLLLMAIVLMAGSAAAAKKHYRRGQHRSAFIVRPIAFEPVRQVQPVRQSSTFGPFGQPYHPYWDPYGSYNHYTFYRHTIKR